jgi:hypothetical protein
MRAIPGGPAFDRTSAHNGGWSDSALARAVRSGRLVQVRRGWYARPGTDAETARAIAAVRSHPGCVLSHRTAAMLHGIPIVGARTDVPELTVRPRGPGNVAGVHLHRATLAEGDIVLVEADPVTSPARTVIDLARSRRVECGVAAIDYVLHEGLASTDDLVDVLRRCWNWPGIARARRAVALSDARSESPLESVSRLVIRWLRLPRPEPQVTVIDRYGRPAGRLDFYWDEFGVAGEADGRLKYEDDEEAFPAEKDRQERLEDDGLAFARWGWTHAWRARQVLRSKVQSAFERGQARDRSGLPRLWSVARP